MDNIGGQMATLVEVVEWIVKQIVAFEPEARERK